MLNATNVREANLSKLEGLGFPRPPTHYPVLWEQGEAYKVRSEDAVLKRIAVLNVVVARTFGMPKETGATWLENNRLHDRVTDEEAELVQREDATGSPLSGRVEALWCLMWTLGLAHHLAPHLHCSDQLAASLPDLRNSQSFTDWRAGIQVAQRSADEIATALDLHFCLTWGIAHANLAGQPAPGEVDQYVLWQRRHALEWVLLVGVHPENSWDDIDLST